MQSTRDAFPTLVKFYGVEAVNELAKRRDDILRMYVIKERLQIFRELLSWLASKKRAYHVVTKEEMMRISGSLHHGGVCALARPPQLLNDADALRLAPKGPSPLLYLAGTENPHNVGAILRTCAHFGVALVMIPQATMTPLWGALARVSRGASEIVPVAALEDPLKTLTSFKKAGYHLWATQAHKGADFQDLSSTERHIFLMGHETYGLPSSLHNLCRKTLTIPGTGAVESLNVSVAAALLLAQTCQRPFPSS